MNQRFSQLTKADKLQLSVALLLAISAFCYAIVQSSRSDQDGQIVVATIVALNPKMPKPAGQPPSVVVKRKNSGRHYIVVDRLNELNECKIGDQIELLVVGNRTKFMVGSCAKH